MAAAKIHFGLGAADKLSLIRPSVRWQHFKASRETMEASLSFGWRSLSFWAFRLNAPYAAMEASYRMGHHSLRKFSSGLIWRGCPRGARPS